MKYSIEIEIQNN